MSAYCKVEYAVVVEVKAYSYAFVRSKISNVGARSSAVDPALVEACRVIVALWVANDSVAVEANDKFVSFCNVENANILDVPANVANWLKLRDWRLEVSLGNSGNEILNHNYIGCGGWKVNLSIASEVDSVDL